MKGWDILLLIAAIMNISASIVSTPSLMSVANLLMGIACLVACLGFK